MGGDAVDDLERQVVPLGDLGADGRVRALDLVVDRLADVVQQAAHLGDLDVGADLGRDDRGEVARLDRVVEHVLAVARAVLEPAEQLDDLGGQARDAGLVGGRLAGLAHDEVDLGARLGDDLLDAAGVDPAVGDELGERRSGRPRGGPGRSRDRTTVSGRVVDDQVDAGGLLEGADVAALAADDPALHLVATAGGRPLTVCSAVWSAATRCIAVRTMSRALSWASSRARALDGAAELDGVVLGLGANGLEQHRLGVLGGHARRRARGRRPARRWRGPGPPWTSRARARGRGACGRAARASPCAGRAARRAGRGGAPARRARCDGPGPLPRPRARGGASRPSPRGSAPSGGRGLRLRCGGPPPARPSSPWDAHMLRASAPSTAPPTAATRATATTIGVSIDCPPIRTGLCGRTRHVCVGTIATREVAGPNAWGQARSRTVSSTVRDPFRWAVIGRFPSGNAIAAAPGTIHVAYGRRFGGSTEGYRTVALAQHPVAAREGRHEEAAPLSRRRFVERCLSGVSGPCSWPWLPWRRCARPLAAARGVRARPCLASRAEVRSALAASRAAVRSALAAWRASGPVGLERCAERAAAVFSVLAASASDSSRPRVVLGLGVRRRVHDQDGLVLRVGSSPSRLFAVGLPRSARSTQSRSWWAIQLT